MKQTRQSIVDLVILKLAQIRVSNGYSCDIGQLVEYAEGIEDEPIQDCVAVLDGREELGPMMRSNAYRQRTLDLTISAAFVGNDPRQRANEAAEDMIEWLDKNPSFGVSGVSVYLESMTPLIEELGRFAELACEIKITY